MSVYSIIQKSQLEGAKRLDAEYYQPEYLELETRLNSIKTQTIDEISESVVNFGAYSLCNYIQWQNSGVPYLNVQDIKDGYIDFDSTKFIDEKVNEILKKSKVKEGQVILTMAGTIGNVAVAHKIPAKVNSNQATAKIILKKEISPYFLAAFFGSHYGKNQITREIVSSVQPNIFLFQIKNFKVPVVSQEKQKKIEKIYIQGLDELENSKSLYSQAEILLLEELGLKNFEAESGLWSVVKLSEVKNVSRIDAEYFQPKYQQIIKAAEKYTGGWKYLEDLTSFINNGNQPPYSENGEIKFLSQKWIGDKGIDYSFLTNNKEPRVSKSFFEDKKNRPYLIEKNDILYYSVGAHLGYCHNYLENEPVAIGSFINLIRPDKTKINPIFLGVCLNSIIGRLQAERDKSGMAQPYIYAKNLRKFRVPIIKKHIQERIADLVQKSHEARKKAKELLKQAKQEVENLIKK